jgi:hypothetical protein
MELFELKTKNRALKTLHHILLATGIVALFYLLLQLLEGKINNRNQSSVGKSKL